jgi:hypothetical protein
MEQERKHAMANKQAHKGAQTLEKAAARIYNRATRPFWCSLPAVGTALLYFPLHDAPPYVYKSIKDHQGGPKSSETKELNYSPIMNQKTS